MSASQPPLPLRSWVTPLHGATLVGLIGGLACIPLAFAIANVMLGERAPRAVQGSTVWLLLAAGVLAAVALVLYRKRRIPFELREENGALVFHIGGRRITGRFEVEYGYFTSRLRGVPFYHAVLQVYADGAHAFTLVETWNQRHGVAEGWPEAPVVARGPGGPAYGGGGAFLADAIRRAVEAHAPR